MITINNLRECLLILGKDKIKECMDNYIEDHVLMEVSFSNACVWVTIESHEYDETTEEEANNNGQLFCHKDTFGQLLEEQNLLSFLD